jgi:hypothetical protein
MYRTNYSIWCWYRIDNYRISDDSMWRNCPKYSLQLYRHGVPTSPDWIYQTVTIPSIITYSGTVVMIVGVISDIAPYQTKIFETTAIYSGIFKSCQVEVGSAN